VTKAFVNRTPSSAIASIFGVRIIGLPAQPIVSARWSSVSRNMIFGGFLGPELPMIPLSQPARDNPAATELPAESLRKSRRFKSFILTSKTFYLQGIDINTSFKFTIDIKVKVRDIK
jgi:hypothetical protein